MTSTVLVLVAPVLRAGPQLVWPDDPAGRDVRAGLRDFLADIDAGNAAAARVRFVGDAGQAELLDARLAFVAAARQLEAAARKRFGAAAPQLFSQLATVVRVWSESAKDRPLLLNVDRAFVPGSGPQEPGYELRRVQGGWRVDRFDLQSEAGHRSEVRLVRDAAAAFDEVRRSLDAGRVADGAAAEQAVQAGLAAAFEQWRKDVDPLQDRPAPAAVPVAKAVGPDALTAAVGKPAGSPEAAKVIGALPGLPRLSFYDGFLIVRSEPAGMVVRFDAETRTVWDVSLYGRNPDGLARYAGDLPHGLTFDLTRRDVERRLGPPPSSEGFAGSRMTAGYPRQGVEVDYGPSNLRDPDARLIVVRLAEPDPDAAAVSDRLPRLAFRLGVPPGSPAAADAEDLADPVAPGARIRVRRAAVLDESHVAAVDYGEHPAGDRPPYVSIEMTPEGGRRLGALTAANVGGVLAIVLDGRVLSAPTINGKIADRVMLDAGRGGTIEDVRRLAGAMHAAVNRLPATRPAAVPAR